MLGVLRIDFQEEIKIIKINNLKRAVNFEAKKVVSTHFKNTLEALG